ncbi:MAG: glgC [Parachlamydiales bacterium]|nr:glgC [Parachlamydiales bacterium]
MDRVISVILAGGEGTRLFPLTRGRCKPDVRFAGRYRLIDIPISNSIHSNIQQIFVLSQHFKDPLHQHILSTYPTSHQIHLLSPKDIPGKKNLFKGTADAVRQNLGAILHTNAEYILILAGDQLYHMNYRGMIDFAKQEGADLVIASLPVQEGDAKRMGLLRIDERSRVLDFFEKPTERKTLDSFALPPTCDHPQEYLGSMGIYVFKRDALLSLLSNEGDDFGKHIIPAQMKKGNVSAYYYQGYWEDIGTIGAYYRANLALTNCQNWMQAFDETNQLFTPHYNLTTPFIKNSAITDSLINEGSLIEAKEVTHSIIGTKTHLKENSIIRDSIIIGDHSIAEKTRACYSVVVGKDCVIQKAIIDSDVVIGDRVQLINKNQLQKFDSDGVYIRDGIIIVTMGARISAGFEI